MGKLKVLFTIALSLHFLSFKGDEPSAFSSDRMNVIYLGLDNPITVAHPRYSCDRLIVKLEPESLGRLEPIGCGKYHLKLLRRDRKGINLLVYRDKVKAKNLLSKEHFRTLKVPRPQASIGGAMGPTLRTEELLAASEVQVAIPGFIYEGINYQVSRYDFIYKPVKGELSRGISYSAQFPESLQKAIAQPANGDLLIISSIYLEALGLGKTPLPGSLVFTIKE